MPCSSPVNSTNRMVRRGFTPISRILRAASITITALTPLSSAPVPRSHESRCAPSSTISSGRLLDEESGAGKEPPPVNAEPFTRQFLRLFDAVTQQPRDQMQKLLRGTTIDPKEYEERGW